MLVRPKNYQLLFFGLQVECTFVIYQFNFVGMMYPKKTVWWEE